MKRSLICLLAVLLLLCTACSGSGAANLNDEAFMPLPSEKFSWQSTLEDIQKLYPEGELSTVGDENEPANYYMFYNVEQGDFGQVLGTDIKSLSFMFRPVLPYNGKENQPVLLQASFTLNGGDYNSLAEQLTKKYGKGSEQRTTPGSSVPYQYWNASKGIRDLDTQCAALALALPSKPFEVGDSWNILTAGGGELAKDAAAWPGLNLNDNNSCKKLVEQIPDGSDGRAVALYTYQDVVLEYAANCMFCAPLAQNLLAGK